MIPIARSHWAAMIRADRASAFGWGLVVTQFVLLAVLISHTISARRTAGLTHTVGLATAAVGVSVLGGASLQLGRDLRVHPAPHASTALRTDGAYRLVRHPIYSGLLLFAAGIAIVNGTLRGSAVSCGLGLLLAVKAHFEERLLARRFPEYAQYASRTPRFVPSFRGPSAVRLRDPRRG